MAKSNKPIFWSLFAAGGTLAAFLAPVLVLLFLMAALGHIPVILGYAYLHAFAANWLGKLFLLGVITLFLWHAAHLGCVSGGGSGYGVDGIVLTSYLRRMCGTKTSCCRVG